jgi:hypothetical protein
MKLRVVIAIAFVLLALAGANIANASDGAATSAVEDASCGGAQATHRAGLVIVFDGERVETLCIEFAEDEISGAELLRRSGLPVVVTGFGGLGTGVCRIDDVGCSDPTDCFCQCRGAECSYWAYYALEDGGWEYLPIGPSQRRLRDGDVDAWVWGSGRQRPVRTGGVCPERAPSPAPTWPPPPGGAAASTATPVVSGNAAAQPEPTVRPGSTTPTVRTTSADRSTPQVRRGANDARSNGEPSAETADDGSSGPPGGLIAFGAVASVATAVIGGLVVRRRLRG